MDDHIVRERITGFLTTGHARFSVDKALRGLPPEARGKRPSKTAHSVFEELEHIRLAQGTCSATPWTQLEVPRMAEGYCRRSPSRRRPSEGLPHAFPIGPG